MSLLVNVQIRKPLFLGSTGATLVRSYSEIAGVSTAFNPSLTDVGDGNYVVYYTPLQAATYIWIGKSSSGVPLDFEWIVETFDGMTLDRAGKLDSLPVADPLDAELTIYTDPLTAGYALNRFRLGAAIVVPTPPGGIDITTLYAKSVP